MSFGTKKDLITWLEKNGYQQMSNGDWFEPGTYYLSHGEYSQPDYSIRRYKDGFSLHVNYYYYSGTFYAPKNGRVGDVFYFGSKYQELARDLTYAVNYVD